MNSKIDKIKILKEKYLNTWDDRIDEELSIINETVKHNEYWNFYASISSNYWRSPNTSSWLSYSIKNWIMRLLFMLQKNALII